MVYLIKQLCDFYACCLMFLHCFSLENLMHCTMLILAHLYSYTLDHAEPKPEEPTKHAQAKNPTNAELSQGKPRCITTNAPCLFI
jgi:hypothetical protein